MEIISIENDIVQLQSSIAEAHRRNYEIKNSIDNITSYIATKNLMKSEKSSDLFGKDQSPSFFSSLFSKKKK
jgi:hypothetical protein